MNLQNEYDLRTARAEGLDQIRPYKALERMGLHRSN